METRRCARSLERRREIRDLALTVAFALSCAGGLFACTSAHRAPPNHALTQVEAETPITQTTEAYTAQLSSGQVPDGSLVVVNVDFKQPFSGKPTARFEDQKFRLYPSSESASEPASEPATKPATEPGQKRSSRGARHFEGLFGVPHSHKPGPATLEITAAGLPPSSLKFEVVEANYVSEVLKVAERKIKPHKKDMPRILREVAEIKKAVRTESPKRYWSGPFVLPLIGRITDAFGTKRVYNGELKSYHGGLDFHAPMGTPIYSAGAGRVIMAENLFFSGNTVMLDHGYGLITMYFHMSKIKVRKGQLVSTHQLLGLSGATGRVTGPHLHWQCDVHDVKVNPMNLITGAAAAELR